MSIRYITKNDITLLEELDRKCFSASVRFNRYDLAYYLSLPNSIGIADIENDKLIGFIITAMVDKDVMNIVTIDVEPEIRNRGIGKNLLDAMIEILMRNDISKITLQVSLDNEKAINFYLNAGFQISKILPNYYPNADGYQMERILV